MVNRSVWRVKPASAVATIKTPVHRDHLVHRALQVAMANMVQMEAKVHREQLEPVKVIRAQLPQPDAYNAHPVLREHRVLLDLLDQLEARDNREEKETTVSQVVMDPAQLEPLVPQEAMVKREAKETTVPMPMLERKEHREEKVKTEDPAQLEPTEIKARLAKPAQLDPLDPQAQLEAQANHQAKPTLVNQVQPAVLVRTPNTVHALIVRNIKPYFHPETYERVLVIGYDSIRLAMLVLFSMPLSRF